MMNKVFDGKSITIKAAADTKSGAIVKVGDIVGIASTKVKAGEKLAIALTGIFELPKKAADGDIAVGTKVYVDSSGDITSTDTSNTFIGKVAPLSDADASGAVAADTTIRVLLCL